MPILNPHVRKMFDEYVREGRVDSRFMRAVLENDLLTAVTYADDDNLGSIRHIALFAHMELPSTCWGSEDKVKAWMSHNGLKGIDPGVCGGWYAPRD